MVTRPEHSPWNFHLPAEHGECIYIQVDHSPAERISALLGPDGEPLRVGYERPKIGFDLRPRNSLTGG